jgi:predicted MPP superfamily phosphohydrolase
MKTILIIGIIAFIALSIWIAKRNGITTEYKAKSKLIVTENDNPVDFGYKIVWIAIKTNNKQRIAEILNLKDTKPSNWKSGIENAYENSVYITPQIGKWTLAVGMKLVTGDTKESIEELEKILNKLSLEFGEAQFFGTHRVVEYHNWMKSVNGKTERIYSYIGESGENIKVFGNPTEIEKGLNLFNSFSKEAEDDNYWEREDLIFADEELVMKIAENWSVNPTKLTERKDIKQELGLLSE